MFKPGEMILYHMPKIKQARPFLVIQAWPNEYPPNRHGYNGILFLDGQNDHRPGIELNPEGKTAIAKYGEMPFAYGYSVPEGDEEGMVSATPNHDEETAALPPMVNISGWGVTIPGPARHEAHTIKVHIVEREIVDAIADSVQNARKRGR